MQLKDFAGLLAVQSLLIGRVSASIDTSPLIVLSSSQEVSLPHEIYRREDADSVVADLTTDCSHTYYIFANHPNVSDGNINRESTPFLMKALEKSKSVLAVPSAVYSEASEIFIDNLKQDIQKRCGALPIFANTKNSASPMDPIADMTPRVITVDFDENVPAAEMDDTLRKVVGRLARPNFLLYYFTTPKQRGASFVEGTEGSEGDSKSLPYESIFRNYQFFSPPLLTALLASLLLVVVCIIALKAVGSLQISTAAFEPKNNAPPKRKQG